jgi:hypothetical protein
MKRQQYIGIFAASLLGFASASGAGLTDEQIKAATAKQASVIKSLEEKVADLEGRKRIAVQEDDRAVVKELLVAIKEAKAALRKAPQRSLEDYLKDIENEKQAAEQKRDAERREANRLAGELATRAAREQAAKAAAEARQAAEEVARKAAIKDEEDRLMKSGGCPLRINGLNFYHADVDSMRRGARLLGSDDDIPREVFGKGTAVSCEIENCIDKPVEAHELEVEFLDGFDAVIKRATLQGTLLNPGEKRRIRNWWPWVETAVQVRVTLVRTKLANGDLWHRKPEHDRVSAAIKKPDGGDLTP